MPNILNHTDGFHIFINVVLATTILCSIIILIITIALTIVFNKYKRLQIPNILILLILFWSDTCSCIFISIPRIIIEDLHLYNIKNCTSILFFSKIFGYASNICLCLMAIERYIRFAHYKYYIKYINLKNITLLFVLFLFLLIGFLLSAEIKWNHIKNSSNKIEKCTYSSVFNAISEFVSLIMIQYLTILCIIIFYILLFYIINKKLKFGNDNVTNKKQNKQFKSDKQILISAASISFCYILMIFPITVWDLKVYLKKLKIIENLYLNDYYFQFSFILVNIYPATEAILLLILNKQIRNPILILFKRNFKCF